MRSIDTETEEYINTETGEVTQRPQRVATKKQSTQRTKRQSTEQVASTHRRASSKRRKNDDSYNFISFLKDYRTHLAFGIFLCMVGLFMGLFAISFLFSNAADQSIIYGHSISEIVESGAKVENLGGIIGAKISEFLLVHTFGIGSFVLAIYCFTIGLVVIRVFAVKFFSFTFRCLFSTCAISIIAGLISYNRDNLFHLGGEHGYYINRIIYQYSDALGAYGVSVLLFSFLIAIYLNPLKRFFSLLGKVMRRKSVVVDETVDNEVSESETTALDTLESNDDIDTEDDGNEIIESDDNADIAYAVSPGVDDIPEAHERYLPKAELDAFETSDDNDDHIEPEEPQHESKQQPEVANVEKSLGNEHGEPELIIVTKQPEEGTGTIKHGDHIGIDQLYDVRASHSNYQFPPTDLLIERSKIVEINEAEQQANKKLIVDALRSYNIEIQRIEATIGPTVTLYEIVPAQGTRIAKIKSLEDDIAMSLSALGIRIIAPIPGKGTVGIEVPNRKPQIVSMRSVLESNAFVNNTMALPMALGSTISNDIYMADLAKMPHLLVAGATGQGKSVGLNCIITSLLYSKHPDELKFVLVDPKTVEFSLFETINKQYLAKLPDEEKAVITDPKKVIDTLNSLCVEMDDRYKLLQDARVRNIKEYNDRFVQRQLNPENGHKFLPYIVVIVDEYADLVMVAGKDVAHPICRIAQKARAVGIHMIIATQRPSTDIITGPIKANFTARIAFKVTQGVDSKTILDRPGAQRLIGRGDMLIMTNGVVERVQCAFIDTPEVEAVCDHIGNQPGFVSCYELPEPPTEDGGEVPSGDIGNVTEEFKRCAMYIANQSQASITSLQRNFEIGFNKAGRFMDQMQQMGIVGPARGAKPRDVLMTPDEVQRLFE